MAATKQKYRRNSKSSLVNLKGLSQVVASVEKEFLRPEFPMFKAGDTVRVHVRIKEGEKERIQPYEGVCIARSNAAGSKSFNVRKLSSGVGVERIFLESSPKVAKVEIVQVGRVRRAKLYYLRKLEGKAARIDREVETQASVAAKAASKAAGKASK